MKSLVALTGAVLVTCLLTLEPAFTQTTSGQISGRVVDQNDQPIPQADVTLKNQLTLERREQKTDASGEFAFASVQPGTFLISVVAPGFKTLTKEDVVLTASERLSAGTFRMQIGIVTQSITVSAEATPVQTESGERSALLDDKQLTTLLDPARNFMNLTRILPGVVASNKVGQDQLGIYGIDTVNGVRSEYSSVTVDGVNANTNARGIDRVETPLNMDAISEVKILSNNYQAEYGGTSGTPINAVTKSGTRDFHGTVYYYNRNEAYNANDFFHGRAFNHDANGNPIELPKDRSRFNTIGYNVGGPVLIPHTDFNRNRDKLFFFFSQEIWPTVHPGDNNPYQLTVPTALERMGDFSQSLDSSGDKVALKEPQNCGAAQNLNCLLDSTHIDPNFINPSTQKLVNLLPLPNAVGGTQDCGTCNFQIATTEKNPVNQKVLRLDYNISNKWHAYFRGVDMSVRSKGNDAAFKPMIYLANFPVEYHNQAPNVTLDVTYIANPTLVNELNIGWASWSEDQVLPNGQSELAVLQKSALGVALGQFRPQLNPLGLIPALTFGGNNIDNAPSIGFFGTNGSRFPIHSQSSSYGLSDGLTKVWSRHISKGGIYVHIDRYVQLHSAGNFAGLYNFSVDKNRQSIIESGNTYANALLGNFLQYSESTGAPDSDPHTRIFDWYVQDNWKIVKSFTLDYGVRFTWDMPQTLLTGANFVPDLYDPTQKPVLYQPGTSGGKAVGVDPRNGNQVTAQLIGAVVPGSGNPFDGLMPIKNTNVIRGQGVLVAPRLGFAWDIFGDGKTALRGGTGVFYNSRPPSSQTGDLTTNPPIQSNPIHPFGNISQLFSISDNGVIFPSGLNRSLQQNGKRPVFYNSSLGIQRRLGFQTVLDVAYVGTLGRHLGETFDLNALPPGTRFLSTSKDFSGKLLPDDFLRRYTGLGSIPLTRFEGTSNYNSLQVSLTRRFTRGLSFGANYTWAKALDFSDSTGSLLPAFAPLRAYSYGLASFDRDHTLKVNWLWNVPKASRLWSNTMTRAVFDDWQLSGIASFVRGAPMGVNLRTNPGDLTGGSDAPRALLVGNPVLSPGDRTLLQYLNTSAVTQPPVNTVGSNGQYSNFVGNAGKVVFRGPGINNWDVALFKNIPIKEKMSFQLRTEFYNLFNHPSFNAVNNTAQFDARGRQTNMKFGQLTSDLGPRQIQFAARISF